MRAFELFLQTEKVSSVDWVRLETELTRHTPGLAFEIVFQGGTIELYVYGETDLSLLSTKLSGFLLKPVERTSQQNHRRSISFTIPNHKNILEVREMEQLKKQRIIERIIIQRRKVLFFQFYSIEVYLKDERGEEFRTQYRSTRNPLTTIDVDFRKSFRTKKKTPPLFLKMGDDTTQLLTPNPRDGFLEVFGFPYVSQPSFFPLTSFDLNKHTLIVGQTGVGKSKFIELFVKEIKRQKLENEYAIIVVDPHASLAAHFTSLQATNIDFQHTSCELFPTSANPNIATELTLLLFKTLMGQQFHAKMERVLKYTIYTLLLTNSISLPNLKQFLTELSWRKQILSQLKEEDHLIHFFETEFAEIQTKFYEAAIMPILVLLDELSFIPVFSQTAAPRLESILGNTFLTCLSLNRIFLGEKATRLIAGLIVQQLFLIAQKQTVPKKIILIIDEVSLIENESLIAILSEARKFGLSLVLAQQYLTQISPELLRAILSNVYNYFIFKVSDEDARMLTKNIQMYFSDETVKQEKEKGHTEDDLKRDMLVHLNPRELIARVFSHDRFISCFKAKTISI